MDLVKAKEGKFKGERDMIRYDVSKGGKTCKRREMINLIS